MIQKLPRYVLPMIVIILILVMVISLIANYYKREGLTINLSDEDIKKVNKVVTAVSDAMSN
jgi:hypothetical protein